MTWSIGIGGHNQHESDDEHKAFEEELVERVRGFVATLEGVSNATVTGNKIGTVTVLSQS